MGRPAGTYGANTLNSLYFGIGFSIILALLVALVGPMFVDWTAYRAAFETEASQLLGHPVYVRGTADARLLPYPSLRFTDVTIGEDDGKPLMTVREFDAEIELFPLLSGEVNVTAMHVKAPVLNVRIAEDGTFEWIPAEPRTAIDPGRVRLSQVDIIDGSLHVSDARHREPIVVDDINLTLDARSLVGPYKADGSVSVGGTRYDVKMATGSNDGSGRFPLKASLTTPAHPVALVLDGLLAARERRPEWTGKLGLSRIIAENDHETRPWTLSGDVAISSRQVLARSLEFSYGREDRPFSITGAATLHLDGTPNFEAVLTSRQLDLDRTLGKGPDAPVDLSGVLGALSDTLAGLPPPPIDGHVGLSIPGIVAGGNVISDVEFDVTTTDGGWTVDTLDAMLPGHSKFSAAGRLMTSVPVAFEGNVALDCEQPATLIGWWMPDRPKSLLDGFSASGHLSASADGFRLSELDAKLKDGRLSGEIGYVPARGTGKPRINLTLDADRLKLTDVEAAADLFSARGGSGPDVVVQAKVGELDAGDARAEEIDVSAALTDAVLDVDRFFVRSLAGARVSASGTIRDITTTPDGSIQLRLSAEKVDGLADLARALLPGTALAETFRRAASVLSPLALETSVTAKAAGQGTALSMEVKGNAASTDIAGTLSFKGRIDRWDEADTSVDLALSAPNGVTLMRQFGLDVGAVGAMGGGHLEVSSMGRPREGLALVAKAEMGPTDLALNGSLTLSPSAAPKAEVEASVKSPDVGGLLALTGSVLQGVVASTPVDLAAHMTMAGPKITIGDLKGTVDGEPMNGDLVLDRAGERPRLGGNLAMRSTSLAALGEMVLGPGILDFPIIESRNPWPEAPFGPALIDGFDSDVALSFGAVAISDGLTAHNVSFALRNSPSGTGFDEISAELAGGRAGGTLVVKRDLDGTAGITGTLSLKGAAASDLAWRRDDRPVVTGALSADIQIGATGRTIAGWIASLSGGGAFSMTDGALRSMTTRAFTPVIQLSDAGKGLAEDRIRQVFTDNVDVGDLAFKRVEATFTLAAGTLRAPNIVVTGGLGQSSGSATIDLSHRTLSSEWRLAASPDDAEATGGAGPQVAILFSGPMDHPVRKIDVTAFVSYLGIRTLEQETKRVLTMQADILERELLSRVVLRDREAQARRDRLAADARGRAEAEEAALAALKAAAVKPVPPKPEPAKVSQKPASAKSGDDFTDQIAAKIKSLQDAPVGTPLAPLPSTVIGPPPGGTSASSP